MTHFLKKNKPLVILEMANNHMGDLIHAKKIILEYSKITKMAFLLIIFFIFLSINSGYLMCSIVPNNKNVQRYPHCSTMAYLVI